MGDLGGRPVAFDSVEDLQEAIDNYFNSEAYIGAGDDRMFAPTMAGLAMSCGVDRKTILNYSKKDGFSPLIKKAKMRVETHLEQRLYGHQVTGVIFNLKNNFGWADKVETSNVNLNKDVSNLSDAELEQEIARLANE